MMACNVFLGYTRAKILVIKLNNVLTRETFQTTRMYLFL